MHLTQKQIELLQVIGSKNNDGTEVDLDQIIERVSWHPKKDALQFSIRALMAHGLIKRLDSEKRRGRSHRLIALTDLGLHFAASASRSYISTVEEDELLQDFA